MTATSSISHVSRTLIIIEVDGYQHREGDAPGKDAARDAHFKCSGFTVLRFSNSDVRYQLDGVLLEVLAALGAVVKQE